VKLKVVALVVVLLAGTGALAAALVGRTQTPPTGAAQKCAAPDARIVVDLAKHTLALCDKEKLVDAFDVRLGRGGTGKTREGDGKTPVGTYSLGEPRPSNRYGIFIPIGFPTDEQKKNGYTGSAVGVHGPLRWVKWLGRLVNTFDSSDGCVGIARDSEIETIASWVRAASVSIIELR
jgi:L,D-peptidoglycan transpeptidase YkuD (ErfK/YbiS/YcfS/YnhG family)